MKTQEQFLEEILQLKKEKPELEIHFCVDSDEILESGWTVHKITQVEISTWYQDDERILTEDGEILDHFTDEIEGSEELTDDEVEKIINSRFEKEVKLAICVYTHAG